MTTAAELASYASSFPSFRNRIINGDMRIDQRNAGSAVTPSSTTYTLDRYRLFMDVGSKLTVQRVQDAPAGFTYSTRISVANSYTPNTNEQFFFGTAYEADNVGDLGFGTATSKTTTLSFWIKSSVIGTYSFSWTNDANNRSYVDTFEILSQNTWEKKTITIVGDNTGTWINTGNGRHSFMQISLGAGSSFYGTADIWQSGNLRQTSGSIDFVNQVNGSTLYITGVQLEVGTVATEFEHRPIGAELALCQRYYEKSYFGCTTAKVNASVSSAPMAWNYKIPKRAAPSSITVSFQDGNKTGVGQITFSNTVSSAYTGGTDSFIWESSGDSTNTGQYTTQWIGIVETEL